MKKFLTKLLIFAVIILGAFLFLKIKNTPKKLQIGDSFQTKSYEYALERFEFADKIGTSFEGFCLPVNRDYSYKKAPAGRTYISISFTIENISKENIDFSSAIGTLKDSDGYVYEIDDNTVDHAKYYFDPADNTWKPFEVLSAIEPRTGKIQCIAYFEVPEYLENSGHPLQFLPIMELGSKKQSYIIQ